MSRPISTRSTSDSDSSPADKDVTQHVPVTALWPADSPRVHGEDFAHAAVLAELYGTLPPIVVHRGTMRVVDGMHRLQAARMRGSNSIDVVFFDGTEADAFVLSVELNRAHGLPLSAADRRAAALRIISSHPNWSDRRIAAVTGMAPSTIGTIRARSSDLIEQSDTRIGLDGRARPRDIAAGRRHAAELMAADPATPLRQVARIAGISPTTAADVRTRLARDESPFHRSRPVQRTAGSPPVPIDSIANLRRDPSLRFTEAGRLLLRLFEISGMQQRRWAEMSGSVPAHQRGVVVDLARQCAVAWDGFADRLAALARDTPPADHARRDPPRRH
jgi:ParB-like chromosome segregation protein Spo0J